MDIVWENVLPENGQGLILDKYVYSIYDSLYMNSEVNIWQPSHDY